MVKINVNTKDGVKQFTTEKIKGNLKAVIITPIGSRISKTRVLIESELGYTILDYKDLDVANYVPICTRMINKDSHYVNEWTTFYLDEKLKITVYGGKNQEVQIILRMG